MEIKILKNSDSVHLIKLSGALDLSCSDQIKNLILKMIEKKAECFIIDLLEIDTINPDGVGTLTYVSSTLKQLRYPLVIIAHNGLVTHALKSTRTLHYFTIAPNLKEANALIKNAKAAGK